MTLKAATLSFTDLVVGQVYEFTREISENDVAAFAQLSGDFNPLHVDSEYAKGTPFGRPLVHGMLAGSLFSTLVGMYCPGVQALYLSQTLNFRSPVRSGEVLTVRGTVVQCVESTQLLVLKTEILHADGSTATNGEARVCVRSV